MKIIIRISKKKNDIFSDLKYADNIMKDLNIDNQIIQNPVITINDFIKSKNDFSHEELPGIHDFINHKKECAINASLQLLIHTISFVKFLVHSKWDEKVNPNSTPMTRILTSLTIKY